MSREAPCGPPEAQSRTRLARAYLDVAAQTAEDPSAEARSVAAGNAVLAAIAASDALCCVHLGKRARGQDHRAAATMLGLVRPDGATLAAALQRCLAIKDSAHYGDRFLAKTDLTATLRAATRLVRAAEAAVPQR